MTVQYALLKCYTVLALHRHSSANILLPPDQHHCSDEAKWRLEGNFWWSEIQNILSMHQHCHPITPYAQIEKDAVLGWSTLVEVNPLSAVLQY